MSRVAKFLRCQIAVEKPCSFRNGISRVFFYLRASPFFLLQFNNSPLFNDLIKPNGYLLVVAGWWGLGMAGGLTSRGSATPAGRAQKKAGLFRALPLNKHEE
jgi:hypothetical protein